MESAGVTRGLASKALSTELHEELDIVPASARVPKDSLMAEAIP